MILDPNLELTQLGCKTQGSAAPATFAGAWSLGFKAWAFPETPISLI